MPADFRIEPRQRVAGLKGRSKRASAAQEASMRQRGLDKKAGASYYPDTMTSPANDLRRLQEWAKSAASSSLRDNEFSRARMSTEILELCAEIEKKLGSLVKLEEGQDYEYEHAADKEQKNDSEYPLFFVRGEFLVKQGKTRDKQDIYEQKLASGEFERIVGALREIAQSKKEFDVRDLLNLAPVPNYQVYLLLGALQGLGMIQIPRRGMYSFVEPKRFPSESSSAWQRLANNHAERR
jgi:hypothetical protein